MRMFGVALAVCRDDRCSVLPVVGTVNFKTVTDGLCGFGSASFSALSDTNSRVLRMRPCLSCHTGSVPARRDLPDPRASVEATRTLRPSSASAARARWPQLSALCPLAGHHLRHRGGGRCGLQDGRGEVPQRTVPRLPVGCSGTAVKPAAVRPEGLALPRAGRRGSGTLRLTRRSRCPG